MSVDRFQWHIHKLMEQKKHENEQAQRAAQRARGKGSAGR